MSEIQGIDPTTVTPEEFAQLVANADDDQITAAFRAVGTEEVLDRIFEGMQERFVPEKAQGVNADIQWVVTDDGSSTLTSPPSEVSGDLMFSQRITGFFATPQA